MVLKNLLVDKSVSIAAPASYWYLKGFPIAHISKVVDYIVYMTYDLHGQVSGPLLLSSLMFSTLTFCHLVGRRKPVRHGRMPLWNVSPQSCQPDRDYQCFCNGQCSSLRVPIHG